MALKGAKIIAGVGRGAGYITKCQSTETDGIGVVLNFHGGGREEVRKKRKASLKSHMEEGQ